MRDDTGASRWPLLASPTFIAAVGLLLLNDFVLKAAFHNALTGKLSDFAGLFAVTLFVSAIRPANARSLAVGIAIFFIWWKSPASQPAIDAVNAVLPVRIGRVIDYTDLIALPMIPLAWHLAPGLRALTAGAWLRVSMAGISVLAFGATSTLNHDTIKQSLQFSPATVPQSELTAAIDAVAARHGLKCAACDSIALGRMYTVDGVRHQESLYLAVSLDLNERRLDYEAGTLTRGQKQTARDFRALSNDLIVGVRDVMSAFTLAPTKAFGQPQGVRLTVSKRKEWSSRQAAVEQYERERAGALIAEIAQNYEFRADGPDGFRRGRLLGTRWEVTLSSFPADLIWISVTAVGEEHAALLQQVANELEMRLKIEFGSERVTRKG